MWYPGMERPYNEFLSPKITYALGRTILVQASLAALHPGLVQVATDDKFTPSLYIRARLQTQAKHSPSDVPAQVTYAYTAAGGKKKK